jgi:hypothetical protein
MSNVPDRWIDPTQSSGISQQLAAGIRGFQIDSFVSPANAASSATVNEYELLLARAQRCQQERGLVANLVAVNFWAQGVVIDVVDELNGVR